MKVALEYELAKRMRFATRWVEGQQGIPSSDDEGTVDGFGRTMLVRTGALPTGYTGTMGVPGTTMDRQPSGVNVAGVAVLIKDVNDGTLSANTNYNARLGGYDTGKAVYLVEKGVSSTSIMGIINSRRTVLTDKGYVQRTFIDGYNGISYTAIDPTDAYDKWWMASAGSHCVFKEFGPGGPEYPANTKLVNFQNVESKMFVCLARSTGLGQFNLYFDDGYGFDPPASAASFAIASDPLQLAAHMTTNRMIGSKGIIFRAAVWLVFQRLGTIISAASVYNFGKGWPRYGVDPVNLVGYSPFWQGIKNEPTLGLPLGGSL